MSGSVRIFLALICVVVAALGGVFLARGQGLGWITLGCGVVSLVAVLWRPPEREPTVEASEIGLVGEDRLRELVRGTSLHLREMKYRYSVRQDPGSRACFNAEVNTVRLGFVPVVITDNYTDRQASGYVAFPYDGRRWRGPGLPCAGSPEDAVAHAIRCVEPLGGEETRA